MRIANRESRISTFLRLPLVVGLLLSCATSFAAGYEEQLRAIQRDLPTAYKPDNAQTLTALEALTARTEALVAAHPGQAEPLLWHAFMQAKLGGARKNVSSLGLAKQSRKNFEAAEKLDPKTVDWSANVLLAQLYWNVPGWPLGFGDEKYAQKLFERAIALNPTGAEPHYFYAAFLIDKKRQPEAIRQLELALTAPLRVGEPVDASGFACNAMRCMTHTAETDAKFRAAIEQRLAKARGT